MNGILVLAMAPMIHSGCRIKLWLAFGYHCRSFRGTLAIEFNFIGPSLCHGNNFATPFALLLGYGYGKLLNKVKGSEMMIATYVGFSSVAFMCIMWLLLPYRHPTMVWGYAGTGLRTTISTEGFYLHVLTKFLQFRIGEHFMFPTGMILFFAFLAFLIWAFLHTKQGTAMTAVGSNAVFAQASGINIDKIRVQSVMMSTWLGAIGILVYQQSFGFIHFIWDLFTWLYQLSRQF